MQTFPRTEGDVATDNPLFKAAWLLYFAGIPFLGLSSVGGLFLLVDWIRRSAWLKRIPPPPPIYRVAIVGLLVTFVLGGINAVSRYDAFGTALGYGVVLLFGAAYVYPLARFSPNWYVEYLWIIPISATVHALWGLYEFALTGQRVTGIHVHPNAFGTAMLISLFLGAGALLTYSDRRRWLVVPYTALVGAAMLVSSSRGAWVGAVAGIVTLGVLAVLSRRGLRRMGPVAGLAVLLLAMLIAVSAWASSDDFSVASRAASIFDLQANHDRVVIYQSVWNMFKAYPLFGVGLNNIKVRYAEFLVDPDHPHQGIAHNLVLQYLGETGVVGALFFGLLWFGWLVLGFPRQAPVHAQVVYALLVAFFVRDQFDGALTNLNVFMLANWLGATLIGRRSAEAAAGVTQHVPERAATGEADRGSPLITRRVTS